MRISEAGIELIKHHEGLRLAAYLDSVGIATIGYGHTAGVKMGQKITEVEAHEFLIHDIETAEKCIANSVRVPLTQGQFDALCSFVFNLGCGALKNSTLLRKLNDGDDVGAAREFTKWIHAGSKVLLGLVARREAEAELFSA